MKIINKIEKDKLKELINQSWMTHDAMWLYHSVEEYGMKKTNKINTAAVKSMAKIEARRLKVILGLKAIQNMNDLRQFIEAAVELLMPKFMKFDIDFKDNERMIATWHKDSCFAYKGVKKMGVVADYQCGIFPRMEGWLESLKIKYTLTPEIKGCLMHTTGTCQVEFLLEF